MYITPTSHSTMNPRLDLTPQIKRIRSMKNCVVIVKRSEEFKEVLCRTELVNHQFRIRCSRKPAVGTYLGQNKEHSGQSKFLATLGLKKRPTVPILQVYKIHEPDEHHK